MAVYKGLWRSLRLVRWFGIFVLEHWPRLRAFRACGDRPFLKISTSLRRRHSSSRESVIYPLIICQWSQAGTAAITDLISLSPCQPGVAQEKKEAHTGGVTLFQRFGFVLNLNVHLTCMDALMLWTRECAGTAYKRFLDGVYVCDGIEELAFHRSQDPAVE
jgi:hypothetical protein